MKDPVFVLGDGKSVVIDNTHVNPEACEKYVDMASKFKIPCRCFVMATTLRQVRALIRIPFDYCGS